MTTSEELAARVKEDVDRNGDLIRKREDARRAQDTTAAPIRPSSWQRVDWSHKEDRRIEAALAERTCACGAASGKISICVDCTRKKYDEFNSIRRFETGATRNDDTHGLDYEGFLSPLALRRFAEYMHVHRVQSDGQLRDSDNWQKGMPLDSYMKSGFRHFMDWWLEHRGHESRDGIEDALCALIFNAQGYLHELLSK